jgi:hypothetical protein
MMVRIHLATTYDGKKTLGYYNDGKKTLAYYIDGKKTLGLG